MDVFSQPDGAATFPRKVFMTQSTDAQGNTTSYSYDGSYRLVAVTDAIGQVTTLSYQNADPLKITKVTDPFGRFASFDYDPQSGHLVKITDAVGIVSAFNYASSDFIQALTTPYGTTSFAHGESANNISSRWLEALDPLGGKERLEYQWGTAALPATEPAAVVPAGFASANVSLDQANSFFWDKRAMALYPGDYTKASITHWLQQGAPPNHQTVDDREHEAAAREPGLVRLPGPDQRGLRGRRPATFQGGPGARRRQSAGRALRVQRKGNKSETIARLDTVFGRDGRSTSTIRPTAPASTCCEVKQKNRAR